MKYKYTKYEQETILNFNREEDEMSFYTADPTKFKKLRQLTEKFPLDCTLGINDGNGMQVFIPKSWFRFPTPPKKLSETDRENRIQRLKSYNESKK